MFGVATLLLRGHSGLLGRQAFGLGGKSRLFGLVALLLRNLELLLGHPALPLGDVALLLGHVPLGLGDLSLLFGHIGALLRVGPLRVELIGVAGPEGAENHGVLLREYQTSAALPVACSSMDACLG